jgi:hypothetical protein
MTDQELKDLIASIAVLQKENALRGKEIDHRFEEAARRSQEEADRRSEEADRRSEEAARRSEEAARRSQELDRQFKETDKKIKELAIQIGGLGNKFGSFTEGMAFASMEKILREYFGLETISSNVKSRKGERELELDVLGYSNGESNNLVIVEVKSHLNEKGIEQTLKTLEEFPSFFLELANKKRYGMIATVSASKEIKEKVAEAGLYLGIIHDEQFKLTKPKNFKPRCFC